MSVELTNRRWCDVFLRFAGDSLPESAVIEHLLQLPTSSEGRKGEHFRANPRYIKHSTHFWGWSFTTNSKVSFQDQLSEMLDILEPKAAAFKELLGLPGVEAELMLGYGSESGQGGGFLPASLINRISALGLAIDLHLYPPSEWKEEPGDSLS